MTAPTGLVQRDNAYLRTPARLRHAITWPISNHCPSAQLMSAWKQKLWECINHWDKAYLVSSPDIDGLLSAAILANAHGAQLIGLYTTSHLLLFEQFKPEDALCALWTDQDINHPSIQCIGQHVVSHSSIDRLPTRHPQCFNPNAFEEQTFPNSFGGVSSRTRDKYPFATCHLLLDLYELDSIPLNNREMALLAHADGSFANIHIYAKNCYIWKNLMFSKSHLFETITPNYADNLPIIREHRQLVEQLASAGIRRAGSKTQKRDLPNSLEPLTGHQSIPYAINHRDEAFLSKLNRIIEVVGEETQFKLPTISRISSKITGTVEEEYPNRILKGEFDDFLVEQHVFSHAFTSQSKLRFTTMLDTPLDFPQV